MQVDLGGLIEVVLMVMVTGTTGINGVFPDMIEEEERKREKKRKEIAVESSYVRMRMRMRMRGGWCR
jgi:hypothetical protein